MLLGIEPRDLERIIGDIDAIHLNVRHVNGAGDGDAATSRAHVEDPLDGLRVEPGLKALLDEFRDG